MANPNPDTKKDNKVKKYRTYHKLSFREIGKLTDEDVKTVYRRWKRAA